MRATLGKPAVPRNDESDFERAFTVRGRKLPFTYSKGDAGTTPRSLQEPPSAVTAPMRKTHFLNYSVTLLCSGSTLALDIRPHRESSESRAEALPRWRWHAHRPAVFQQLSAPR